jgi:hypothetical protein
MESNLLEVAQGTLVHAGRPEKLLTPDMVEMRKLVLGVTLF